MMASFCLSCVTRKENISEKEGIQAKEKYTKSQGPEITLIGEISLLNN
jgi:hypothetical protein